jgi:hypothetical protein
MTPAIKNLAKEPPRSPRVRLGDYAILARMIDKGRAELNGTAGDYHFACPLDQNLCGFKGVETAEVKKLLATGASDEEVVAWFNANGTPKTAEEIKAWSDAAESMNPYHNPERKEWFIGECTRLGINPEISTIPDYLEADDADTFKSA